jgi:hypothetical protein
VRELKFWKEIYYMSLGLTTTGQRNRHESH